MEISTYLVYVLVTVSNKVKKILTFPWLQMEQRALLFPLLICSLHREPFAYGELREIATKPAAVPRLVLVGLSHASGERRSQTSGFPLFQMEISSDYCQISNFFVDLSAFTVANLHLVQHWLIVMLRLFSSVR